MCVMQVCDIIFSIFCRLTKLLKCIANGVYEGRVGANKEDALEFFLNGAELSLNSVISVNLGNLINL